MKLYSHGPNSDLLEHLREVMEGARTLQEKILFACHDIVKAHPRFQDYLLNGGKSPFPHAAAGGYLAAFLITEHGGGNAGLDAMTAFHTGAAHHTVLNGVIPVSETGLEAIVEEPQVRSFFLDRREGIASLLPEIPEDELNRTWKRFQNFRTSRERLLEQTFSAEERIAIFLSAREQLGRLCRMDHLSAAHQSGKSPNPPDAENAFAGERSFQARPKRSYPPPSTRLQELRGELKRNSLARLEENPDAVFYFIDAPTGLGKTETMLSAAEILCAKKGRSGIVFSVPQVSIADQIFDDYLNSAGIRSQIWNYRRKEQSPSSTEQNPSGNAEDDCEYAPDLGPFDEIYNVTTFNQVLLAMCHPDRRRCIRGLGLSNAVIIMDEFHKLPQEILPVFFPIVREFARRSNCTFILGSATPLELLDFWDLTDAVCLSGSSASVYTDPAVDARRIYRKGGQWNVEQLGDRIEEVRSELPEKNILVVVNLVNGGTFPLRQRFLGEYQPYSELEKLRAARPENGPLTVFLDGLLPPGIRRDIIRETRRAMETGIPVTFISTQMVEVGVDLDFDYALVDYQGIAATIQRGGRVGRNGRPGAPCTVEVFALMTAGKKDNPTDSFERLHQVVQKNNERYALSVFQTIAENCDQFHSLDRNFFLKETRWKPGEELSDSMLAEKLRIYQKKAFGTASKRGLLETLFRQINQDAEFGFTFLNAQMIAELFSDTPGEEWLILDSTETFSRLMTLSENIVQNQAPREEKKLFFRMLSDYKLTISSAIRETLQLSADEWIKYPEQIPVHLCPPAIF